MITIGIVLFTIIFGLAAISPLLITDDVRDAALVGQ